MGIKLKYEQLCVYSKENSKCFHTKFKDGVNIVYGKNTSGKSTLIQLIHYTVGINDELNKLAEILEEKIISRLDCFLDNGKQKTKIIFIRDNDTVTIKRDNLPIETFDGIHDNNTNEHKRLKKYIRDLFDFKLFLEQKGIYKESSIETIFLPYYIAQDVGWTSVRQSFKGMSWYKNFKEDFLDYYLGIENSENRLDKIEKEKELKEIQIKKEFYSTVENNDINLIVSKITDEAYMEKSNEYIKDYKNRKEDLLKKEKEYVLDCNKLSYYKERKSVLSKVIKNIKKQNPDNNANCPICEQKIEYNVKSTYAHYQDLHDTEKKFNEIKEDIKKIQTKIDKFDNDKKELQASIDKEYKVLNKYTNQEITYETWIENKASLVLSNQLDTNIAELTKREETTVAKLQSFKTEDEIKKERIKIDNKFQKIFLQYLQKLGLTKNFKDDRFKKVYRISAFPTQGVELHKTILAYNFSFINLLNDTSHIHQVPFMMDAIFKEDIEEDNEKVIIDFISKKRNKNIQLIISIAESKEQTDVAEYNKSYFDEKANLICIGKKINERAFLSNCSNSEIQVLIDETNILVNG